MEGGTVYMCSEVVKDVCCAVAKQVDGAPDAVVVDVGFEEEEEE